MPLVRYEIRNEHSLANPQLYRTAAQDDPEGLLEGVAMAGLVGIVRQLGDLAEFAAEVFRDLHEEVLATASRGHELLVRVQQLEAEMPAVEKALLSETNQLRFAYTPGVEWHASIRNDQNHCTQGDLPRFIRNSYEECRGPPRLFLLDKFDVAGAGACLKRYTDPSFFRTEWASSELMKAERIQRDKKAKREKKKGRRRRSVDAKDSRSVDPFQQRFSHELSRDLAQHDPHLRNWHHSASERMDEAFEHDNVTYNENVSAISRHLAEAQAVGRDKKSRNAPQDFAEDSFNKNYVGSLEPISLKLPQSTDFAKQRSGAPSVYFKDLSPEEKPSSLAYLDETPVESKRDSAYDVDDVASEGEQFLDALTTMESEVDTDSDPGFKQEREMNGDRSSGERVYDSNELQTTSQVDLKSPNDVEPADIQVEAVAEYAPQSVERITADDFQSSIAEVKNHTAETVPIYEDMSARPPVLSSAEEEIPRSGLGSPVNAREELGTRHHHVPVMQWNGSAKQYSPKSQHYAFSPRADEGSAEGLSELATGSRMVKDQSEAGPELAKDSDFQHTKEDANGSINFAKNAHVRQKSMDSVISSASRKAYRGESMEDSREHLAAVPKVSIFKSDSRSTSMRVDQDDMPSPLGAARKVSKMVAAFEAGSLEPVQDIDRREERRSSGRKLSPRMDATASVITGNGRSRDSRKVDATSLQDSYSPAVESPASEGSNSRDNLPARFLPQHQKLRVDVSSSSRLSVGSVDSPPRSPIFSALHSPMSPIRASRNILSSPDSPGFGFSSQILLSPSSPTFVPVLDSSPTSNRKPPSMFSRNHDSDFQLHSPSEIDEPLDSPSSLPTELLSTQSRLQAPFMSPAQLNMLHDGPTSSVLPPEDWSSHFSPSPMASPRDVPTPSGEVVSSERRWTVDNCEDLESCGISTHDVTHASQMEEEQHSSLEYPFGQEHMQDDEILSQISSRSVVYVSSRDARGLPKSESVSDIESLPDDKLTEKIPTVTDDDLDESSEDDEIALEESVSASSPHRSVSDQDPKSRLSEVRHDDDVPPTRAETSSGGMPEQVQLEIPSHFSASRVTHKRFPSQPPLGTASQDFYLPISRTSIFSKAPRVAPGPGPNPAVERQLPFQSPALRPVQDSPFFIPRGTHRRHPSFPTSQKPALDFLPIARSRRLEASAKKGPVLVEPVLNADAQTPKRPLSPPSSSLPSEELHSLPISSPPSSSRRHIASPPPSPFGTLHELHPPPPPSRSPPPLTGSKVAASGDSLLEAITSHDKTTLKKVKTMQNPSLRRGDDRAQMLEQIRAQSFNLRHTVAEKSEPPVFRPVTNINVAAILEKANAIRQALAGSDEEEEEDDDDWSDT